MKNISYWFLGICFIAGMYVLGLNVSQTILKSHTGVNKATVKGLAERVVDANQLRWDINFYATITQDMSVDPNPPAIDRQALYDRANNYKAQILAVLSDAGFTEKELDVSTVRYSSSLSRNDDGVPISRTGRMDGSIRIVSDQLSLVGPAERAFEKLTVAGIGFDASDPEYYFTDLNEIKPDMLKEATKNARIAAEEFASDAGVQVGGIQTATQGGFSVRDLNDESSDRYEPSKKVRVVTTITFYLSN